MDQIVKYCIKKNAKVDSASGKQRAMNCGFCTVG